MTTPREVWGHWFGDDFYAGDWHLRAKENAAERALVLIGDPETLEQIEETRTMHRLLFQRLLPAQKAWQKAHGKGAGEFEDLGRLVEWLLGQVKIEKARKTG